MGLDFLLWIIVTQELPAQRGQGYLTHKKVFRFLVLVEYIERYIDKVRLKSENECLSSLTFDSSARCLDARPE